MAADYKELEAFRDKLQALSDEKTGQFCDECTKELTARLLAKVIKRTPVGKAPKLDTSKTVKVKGANGKTRSFLSADAARHQTYWSGYVGGSLRRGWTGGQNIDAQAYAQAQTVKRIGNEHKLDVINNEKYAMYVEYGHRQTPGRYVPALGKRLKQSWVKGQFMMTDSVHELEGQAQQIVQSKLDKFINEELGND